MGRAKSIVAAVVLAVVLPITVMAAPAEAKTKTVAIRGSSGGYLFHGVLLSRSKSLRFARQANTVRDATKAGEGICTLLLTLSAPGVFAFTACEVATIRRGRQLLHVFHRVRTTKRCFELRIYHPATVNIWHRIAYAAPCYYKLPPPTPGGGGGSW